MSPGSISTSTSSASGSTFTVAEEVCTRPWDSVTGILCTRCVPASWCMRCQASSPLTRKVTPLDAAELRLVQVQHVDAPAPVIGVALVHVEQVLGEQVRLLPALGARGSRR